MPTLSTKQANTDIRARIKHAEKLRLRFRRRMLAIWWRWVMRTLRHREGAARLRALDDQALSDLGLSRSNIEAASRGLLR